MGTTPRFGVSFWNVQSSLPTLMRFVHPQACLSMMPSQDATSSFQVVKTTSASVSMIGKTIGTGNKPITSLGQISTLEIEQSSSMKLKACLTVLRTQHLHREDNHGVMRPM